MTGVSGSPTLFGPEAALTRGMTAAAFYSMAGSPDAGKFANRYADVYSGSLYYDAVKWEAANGIMLFNSVDNNFYPDSKITREEAAAAFFNYQRLSGVVPPDVLVEMEPEDLAEISEWARPAAKKLMTQMIFRGQDGFSNFNPKGGITRVEFAGMLRDYCEAAKNK